MKTLLRSVAVAGALALMALTATAQSANPPCPQIGAANGCNLVITIGPGMAVSIQTTNQEAYDGIEDQLVGVINNSGVALNSLNLSGSGIFDFDGDGAATAACFDGNPVDDKYGCLSTGPFAPNTSYAQNNDFGYEGPGTGFTFSISDLSNGSVFFEPTFNGPMGLASGAAAWFSLEGAPASGSLSVTAINGTSVPEPGAAALLALGLLLSFAVVGLRRRVARA